MIQACDVSVTTSGCRILEDVSLIAKAGQLTAIIGPNGSGKTTLLKALCRDYAYDGLISINGRDLQLLRPIEMAGMRAVLPQHNALPFPFTVREVVALGLASGLSGVPLSARKRLPEEALARVDLDGFAGRFYGELSGGEQQRVQLARVLCQVWVPVLDGMPRYLLLDEPVSSLDIKHQLLVMDVARAFANAGGGVIAILHDLNLAAIYADAILALREGRFVGFGAPSVVLTDSLLADVFDCPMRVNQPPVPGIPFVLPQSAIRSDGRQSKVA
ncbi:heme ABC transporter ATP-binding protein [uncultured Devosia sp.]|uniref:heme ABC transporter ATP-binding protein n=1 Tax=uncultured Devosia sp. TaxID=211434 RepID=UPI0035C97978